MALFSHKYIRQLKLLVMKICDKDFTPKFSLRSLFCFEQIAGKAFELTTLFDFYVYFYACILANRENPSLEFDKFIDYCDEHPEIVEEFRMLLEEDRKSKEVFTADAKKKKKAAK